MLHELTPYEKNPRRWTEEDSGRLEDSLDRLGDIGCILFNHNMTLIAGHRRVEVFQRVNTEVVTLSEEPQEDGTLAQGYFLYEGKKYPWRKVNWSEDDPRFEEALLLSNKANEGLWDKDILADFDPDLLSKVGFDPDELFNFKDKIDFEDEDGFDDPLMDDGKEKKGLVITISFSDDHYDDYVEYLQWIDDTKPSSANISTNV